MKQNSGFTLIELMVTIAVAAVLAAVAVPSMQGLIAHNQLAAANNELLSAAMYARSEAVMRGLPVRMCNSATTADSSPTCNSDDSWSSGWIVFVDSNANDSVDTGEDVLRVFANSSSALTITPDSSNARGLVFNKTGRAEGVAASGTHSTGGSTFTTCSSRVSDGRILSISISGRASTTKKDPC